VSDRSDSAELVDWRTKGVWWPGEPVAPRLHDVVVRAVRRR
jgi:hypothetical protein